MNQKIKVARVATVPFFLDHQLKHQIQDLMSYDFNVTAVSSTSGDWSGLKELGDLECVQLDISRPPAPIKDLISLFKLYRFFKKEKFDIIHSTTPKAGLLCAIASWLARVPVRLHTFTGQPWATKKGASRKILSLLDEVIVKLNTRCYADSVSQRAYLNNHGVGNIDTIKVLGKGALAGVDLARFNKDKWLAHKQDTMTELGFSSADFVITFIGRLSKEKGIYELIEAMDILVKRHNNLKLILIGPCEEQVLAKKITQWDNKPFVRHIGETNLPEKYLAISDVLCLPSYREGFGTVVIEAAAMKLPTIGTNITGLVDAIDDGVTGILVEPKSVKHLVNGLEQLINDPTVCSIMGEQAYQRCQKLFDSKNISQLVAAEYATLHQEKVNNG